MKLVVSIILLILVSVAPRLWDLTLHPPMIVDEPANLRDIQKLRLMGGFRPTEFEWGFGQASLIFYPTILLIKMGVHDEFLALRLTSVILSISALIPFFFIVKNYSNLLVAFCTTLLFSFSYYYLQFSRVGWTNIHMLTTGLYLMLFIQLAQKNKAYWIYILSGLTVGILFYMYRAGSIFIFAGTLSLLTNLLSSKKISKIKVAGFLLFICVSLLVAFPWLIKITNNWQLYNLRASVVSVTSAQLPYHDLYNFNEIMFYQITTSVKSWILLLPENGGGHENPRYLPLKYSPVSPPIIILFLAGMVLAILQFRNTFPWLTIFLLGLFFGQILTVDPPNGSRGLILLPVIYLFSGLTLFYIYNKLRHFKYLAHFMLAASFIIAYMDFTFYQYWMMWIKA